MELGGINLISSTHEETWDDTLIIDAFDKAVRSHRFKNQKKRKSETPHSKKPYSFKDLTTEALPGPWEPVPQPLAHVKSVKEEENIPNPQEPAIIPSIHSTLLDDSLNEMLMAWYQSGYATGRYHAIREFLGQTSSSQAAPPVSTGFPPLSQTFSPSEFKEMMNSDEDGEEEEAEETEECLSWNHVHGTGEVERQREEGMKDERHTKAIRFEEGEEPEGEGEGK